jgi:hypothetical protein
MAACQRSIALHAHWIHESVNRTLEHAALHASGEAVASPAQHGEWMRTTLFEPTWHYMVGLMSLSRSTGNSLVTLTRSAAKRTRRRSTPHAQRPAPQWLPCRHARRR